MSGGIAEWEKHTKGIGSKLLQKFGFTGRLGAKENGISRAIEVEVRATNTGLGFGESSTKTGVSDNAQKKKRKKAGLLSDAEKLAESESWKRPSQLSDKDSMQSEAKRTKRTTTDSLLQSYEELLQSNQHKATVGPILDMRQKDVRVVTDMTELDGSSDEEEDSTAQQQRPRLGQELLHNLTQLMQLEKAKVVSETRRYLDERQIRERFQQQIDENERQLAAETESQCRLDIVRDRMQRLQELIARSVQILPSARDQLSQRVHCLEEMMACIQSVFKQCPRECAVYGVSRAFPSLLSALLRPLQASLLDSCVEVQLLCEQWQTLTNHLSSRGLNAVAGECQTALQVVVERDLLPVLRRWLSSPQWHCATDTDRAVAALSALRSGLSQSSLDETIDVTLLPRLSREVDQWHQRAAPMHQWLLPWLPLLGPKLQTVYSDVRRKLVGALRTWHASDRSAIGLLAPWSGVFDVGSWEHLLAKTVVPKLVDYIRSNFQVNPADQSLDELEVLLAWEAVLPPKQFTCIFAGEVMPKWLRALLCWLGAERCDWEEVLQWYQGWRSLWPTSVLNDEEHALPLMSFALDVLQESAAQSLQRNSDHSGSGTSDGTSAARDWNSIHRNVLHTLDSADYYALIKKHITDKRFREKVQSIPQFLPSHAATSLKDVIENIAEKHNLEFKPKFGKTVEGKPVWEFGKCLCYIENSVVFALNSKNVWGPVSLEDLLALGR